MIIDKKVLDNCVYNEQPLMFNPLLPERTEGLTGDELKTGAFTQPNGDILFRIHAPGAHAISIKIRGQASTNAGCELKKGDDGVFEGLYPYDPELLGPHTIDIIVDGTVWIYPYIPIVWHRNKPVNFIEVYDPETEYIEIKNVPHGAITREIFWSDYLGVWLRCAVYTPPGYQKSGVDYPVLYLQHGSTENETCWEYNGRVAHIMDNLLAENKCEPFIIVMNDGMVRSAQDRKDGTDIGFEKSLIENCIPYIDDTYRTKRDKWSRAIAGLSMGSGQALRFAVGHPDIFGSFCMMSGGIEKTKITRPDIYARVLDPEFMEENYKLFFRTMGDAERGYTAFIEETELLNKCGVGKLTLSKYAVYRYGTHEFGCWRKAFHDLAQMLFK